MAHMKNNWTLRALIGGIPRLHEAYAPADVP